MPVIVDSGSESSQPLAYLEDSALIWGKCLWEYFYRWRFDMKFPSLLSVLTLLLVSTFFLAVDADACPFYWSRVEVQSRTWQGCMNIAYAVSQKHNLAQLKRTNLAVTGSRNGAAATLTCFATGANSKAMVVVMVVGDSDGPVHQLHNDLVDAVQKERIMD